MKHINAGVNFDITFQMYSNLHFMGWKWLNTPCNYPEACKTKADIQSMFWTCPYYEIYIKKTLNFNERVGSPIPPACSWVWVYLFSIFLFAAMIQSFWCLEAPWDCILFFDDPTINRMAICSDTNSPQSRTPSQPFSVSQLQQGTTQNLLQRIIIELSKFVLCKYILNSLKADFNNASGCFQKHFL